MKYEKDYYQILGVKADAVAAEIQKAYHRLAISNHPDRNPSPQANARMQEINEAYSIIGNKRNRRKYDAARIDLIIKAPPKDNPATANPQHIFAEDTIPPINLPSILIVASLLAFVLGSLGWGLSSLDFRLILTAILAGVIGLPLFFWLLSVWRNYKSGEIKAQCPKCKKLWAAEKLDEKITGVFYKKPLVSFAPPSMTDGQFDYGVEEVEPIPYVRYKIHCRCRHCGYEWVLLESRRR